MYLENTLSYVHFFIWYLKNLDFVSYFFISHLFNNLKLAIDVFPMNLSFSLVTKIKYSGPSMRKLRPKDNL